jgi:hypothetical protein
MATYQGAPFEAGIGPTDGDIVLFAACPPPEELGFEPATGHWRKQLRFAEVEAVWQSRPVGMFRGERCIVLDDLGDRLHIGFLGHDGYKAEQLGYWQVDRGVFELVAPRTEVSDILEERTEYPGPEQASRPQVSQPPPQPDPGARGWQPGAASGQHQTPGSGWAGEDKPGPASPSYLPVHDATTGVALPLAVEPPLPLEAEALRAASAARRTPPQSQVAQPPAAARPLVTRPPAAQPPLGRPPAAQQPAAQQPAAPQPSASLRPAPVLDPPVSRPAAAPSRQHRAAGRRMATEALFADLANLAGIPAGSYSVGEEIEGALCLIQTAGGFEVFHSAGGSRHELQVFATEEAACFYLFGVLAADAVRTGTLSRHPSARLG